MLYGNTQVNAIIEAAAQGSAVVTVLGVAASGQAGVGAGVEATNAQMGNVGLGAVQGQEVSTISVGAYESAATGIAFGKETQFKVNTFEGVKISAGTQGSLSYDGVSVGGGATVYAPGALGGETNATANFANGNLTIQLSGGLEVGVGGLDLSLNLTLPTGPIVNALENIGLNIGQQAANATAQAIASEATTIANSVSNAVTQAENAVTSAANDAFDWVSSWF